MTLALIVLLALYILQTVWGVFLEILNIGHMKKMSGVIPSEFNGHIDQSLLAKTQRYTIDKTRIGVLSTVVSAVAVIVFVFGGVVRWYDSFISSLDLPFVLAGILFFLSLSYASTMLSIPFSLYRSFVIERKYGFNTMTFRTWSGDLLRSLVLSTVIMTILIAAASWIVLKSPGYWWFYVWGLFFIFSIFMMYIAPYVIEPLFNKFEPVQDEDLLEGIRDVAGKAGITVSRVFTMDASRRTKHTNAYFTGIGKVKRIVLYDTLIRKMDKGEILSVLAHEAGHWKKKHIFKMLFVMEAVSLIVIYGAYYLLQGGVQEIFNAEEMMFFTRLLLVLFIASIALFPFGPLSHALSRRHEREADRFALELTKDPESMVSTFVKLSKDNLSNLHPHPLYASFHYSHPAAVERIREIKRIASLQEKREA